MSLNTLSCTIGNDYRKENYFYLKISFPFPCSAVLSIHQGLYSLLPICQLYIWKEKYLQINEVSGYMGSIPPNFFVCLFARFSFCLLPCLSQLSRARECKWSQNIPGFNSHICLLHERSQMHYLTLLKFRFLTFLQAQLCRWAVLILWMLVTKIYSRP